MKILSVSRRVVLVLLLVSLLAPARPGGAAERGRRREPPNILIIITDDQRYDGMKVMNRTLHFFRSRGKHYPEAFVTSPSCCPSRASIFTGRYAHNNNVRTNSDARKLRQRSTIQHYLQRDGYRTAIFGKYMNSWGVTRDPPFFDRWATFSLGQRGYRGGTWNVNGRPKTVHTYGTTFIRRHAVRFLNRADRHRDRSPWLLYLTPPAPHGPYIAEAKYASADVPGWNGNPSVLEQSLSDKPPYIRRYPRQSFASGAAVRRAQLRTLMSVDDLVSKVFGRLKTLNENRRTLAFFTSDNGYLWAEHGVIDKRVPYTSSIRVPLFMRWPGHVPAHSRGGHIATNIDLAPTILQAAHIQSSQRFPIDGHSLLRTSRRRWLLTEFWRSRDDTILRTPSWSSIRSDRLHYVEYRKGGHVTFRELYRLRRDPWELSNVLHDHTPENNPNLRRLHRKLRQARRCDASACP